MDQYVSPPAPAGVEYFSLEGALSPSTSPSPSPLSPLVPVAPSSDSSSPAPALAPVDSSTPAPAPAPPAPVPAPESQQASPPPPPQSSPESEAHKAPSSSTAPALVGSLVSVAVVIVVCFLAIRWWRRRHPKGRSATPTVSVYTINRIEEDKISNYSKLASRSNMQRPPPGQWYPQQQWSPAPPPCPYPTWAGHPLPELVYMQRPPQQRAPSPAMYASQQPPAHLMHTNLSAAFSTMGLQQSDDNWYMDTGASSHMTNAPGSSYGDPNHALQ